MKKLLLLAVLALPMIAHGQNNSLVISTTIQPSKSLPGSSISYTAGVYSIPSSQWGKAAELAAGATDGVLVVHLVDDPATQWYSMPLTAGNRTAAIFDKIRESGTTVTEASVTIFLNKAN